MTLKGTFCFFVILHFCFISFRHLPDVPKTKFKFANKSLRFVGTFDKCPRPNLKNDKLLISFVGHIRKDHFHLNSTSNI